MVNGDSENKTHRVDAELAIGQCRLGVHGTCGLINPWHHLQKMSSWVGIPGRPPYVIPRGSAGLKKKAGMRNHFASMSTIYYVRLNTKFCRFTPVGTARGQKVIRVVVVVLLFVTFFCHSTFSRHFDWSYFLKLHYYIE